MSPLADLDQVATYTKLPKRTIYDQVHRRTGVGALAFKLGRHLRWDMDEVEQYVASQRVGGQAA